ncbi:MAG: DNA cytosine methyltransferase [Rhodospirillaceae bacterium]|nr:DNA cytosine methyltransferase [Rhodospirillaceae bacterium]
MKRFTSIDLFSGCGGFGLGAGLAGFSTLWAADIDPNLSSSYNFNFPGVQFNLWDISKISDQKFIETSNGQSIDLVTGGPPCQGFSVIGKGTSNDARNSLVSHFFRAVKAIKPKIFVMENVPGLLLPQHIQELDTGIKLVSKNYKILPPMKLTATHFGAATHRTRVLIIGYDPKQVKKIDTLEIAALASKDMAVSVENAISDLPSPIISSPRNEDWGWGTYKRKEVNQLSSYAKKMRTLPIKELGSAVARDMLQNGKVSGNYRTAHRPESIHRFAQTKPGTTEKISRLPRLTMNKPGPTLRAGTGPDRGSFQSVRPIHPSQPRVITVREAARLQGFPDWFLFHKTKWHSFRMIGNSVCPIFAEKVLKVFHKKLTQQNGRCIEAA